MKESNEQSNIVPRSPVVSILGHIDHGKSTLVDYIRNSNVVEREAGGITQHISAYEVRRIREDGRESRITFLDTPGHEAFQNVRTRGAGVADIGVLIVSGEDGVKPQTLEVYKQITTSKVPFIVAITKMDKPTADLERTKQSLAENGIYLEGYGGDIPFVPVSAKTGEGINELLDTISLMSDLLDLKGSTDSMGTGVIIESKLDPKRGITAVGIIKNGTVHRGTFATTSKAMAPLRFILDFEGRQVDELSFSSPIQIVGWDKLPQAGSEFATFLKKEDAMKYISEMKDFDSRPTYTIKENSISGFINLPIILKADTVGSLEAIENEISKLNRERISAKLISAGVGTIGETDVKLAIATPGSVIIGFTTKIDSNASSLAERNGVNVSLFSIIYELTDKISKLLEEREPKIQVEEISGRAKVLKLFSNTKGKQVLGARVLSGKILIGSLVRIIRREVEIGKGKIKELQQARIASSEVQEGTEFGAMLESKLELAPGDILESIELVTK